MRTGKRTPRRPYDAAPGKGNALIRLFRTVPWRNVLWFLLGWVLMLLVPPEDEAPKPPEFAEHARRRNGAQ
jgi:hypothetical protein